MERPILDASTLRLPSVIDMFPDRADNEALYEWLAAWFAHAAPPTSDPDPLRADIHRLRAAVATTRAALATWPGPAPLHDRLAAACLAVRPNRSLPNREAALEGVIRTLLGGSVPQLDLTLFAAVARDSAPLDKIHGPRRYRPFLPVPLWGDVHAEEGGVRLNDAEEEGGDSAWSIHAAGARCAAPPIRASAAIR